MINLRDEFVPYKATYLQINEQRLLKFFFPIYSALWHSILSFISHEHHFSISLKTLKKSFPSNINNFTDPKTAQTLNQYPPHPFPMF
jgi:hypothetical protein